LLALAGGGASWCMWLATLVCPPPQGVPPPQPKPGAAIVGVVCPARHPVLGATAVWASGSVRAVGGCVGLQSDWQGGWGRPLRQPQQQRGVWPQL